MTFFLVIDQVFQIFRFFTVLNVIYDPFFTRKTAISEKNSLIRPFFTLFPDFDLAPKRKEKFGYCGSLAIADCSYFRAHPTTLLL